MTTALATRNGDVTLGDYVPGDGLTVGGVPMRCRVGWSVTETANRRGVFAGAVPDPAGQVRPPIGADVHFVEQGIRVFGGFIDQPSEAGIGGEGVTGIITAISASDYNGLAERRVVTATIPAGTVKAALQVFLPYLSSYGVTLDPAQVAGPALPDLAYVDRVLIDALNEVATLAGQAAGTDPWIWEIDYFKVLRAFAPGSISAPINIASGDGHALGDITVKPTRVNFANRIIVYAGTGEHDCADALGTGDGATTTWPLNYPLARTYGYVTNAGVNETLAIAGPGTDAATWIYDPPTNTVRRVAPPAPGAAISITYVGTFPFRVEANNAPSQAAIGVWERAVTEPDVFSRDVAQALAEMYLAAAMATPKTVQYRTHARDVHPGQTQTITEPKRAISGTYLITDVKIQNTAGNRVERFVTAVEGTGLIATWRNSPIWGNSTASAAGSSTSGGAAGGGVTPIGPGAPALPPIYFLGGAPTTYVQSPTPDWIPADGSRPGDSGTEYVIDTVVRKVLTGTVRVRVRAAAGSVNARLFDLDAGLAVGTASAPYTGTAFGTLTFAVALTAGAHRYQLQLLPSVANSDVNGIGYLQ
jgi:hypothetical protein